MKTSQKFLTCFFTGLLCSGSLHAAVEVIGISLNPAAPAILQTYTVPAGKTLLVENISASYASNNPPTPRVVLQIGLQVQNNAIATMRFGYPIPDRFTAVVLPRPLRVPSGRVIELYAVGDVGYNEVRIQGLLVDNSDLYAANLDVKLEPERIDAGQFVATATLSSPRPARISSFTSTDLSAFVPNATEEKHRLPEAGKWSIATAADGDRKFMVVGATSLERP